VRNTLPGARLQWRDDTPEWLFSTRPQFDAFCAGGMSNQAALDNRSGLDTHFQGYSPRFHENLGQP
jgi:hypothetical protein